MIKDTFFSWKRANLFTRKIIRENYKSLALRLLLMFGVMEVVMLFNGYDTYSIIYADSSIEPTANFMSRIFMAMLFIFGTISASFIMEDLKNKTGKTSFLMNPATSFEKYITKWFIYTILYIIVFIILFIWADSIKVLVYKFVYPNNNSIDMFSFSNIVNFNSENSIISSWYILGNHVTSYIFIQSLFVLGGTIWPKGAYVKTFAALVILISISSILIYICFKDITYNESLDVDGNRAQIAFMVLGTIFAIFNWTIGYFRFKETEIINRI